MPTTAHPESARLCPEQHIPAVAGARSAEAAKRKRERDRDCQRRKRQRDQRYTACLEERIRELEGQLGRSPRPRRTTGREQAPTSDTAEEDGTAGPGSTPETSSQCLPVLAARAAAEEEQLDRDHRRSASLDPSATPQLLSTAASRDATSSETVAVSLQVLEACLAAPQWARLPLHGLSLMSDPRHCIRGKELPAFIRRTRADAGLERLCPPSPRVIDIMYGGSTNPLANAIFAGCSREPLLGPERLAISWALYKHCKWLIWPSMETFACLPKSMHPTAMQLTVQHQWCIDLVLWPELRENMIRNQSRMDMDAAMGLFLCCLRLRGCFNLPFISRQNGGDLEIDPEFYSRFTDLASWGLLEKFWTQYPELVEGLDPSLQIREQDLLA